MPPSDALDSFESGIASSLSFDPDRLEYALDWLKHHDGMLQALCDTGLMRRLCGVSQLGLKRGTIGVPSKLVPFCDGQAHRTVALPSFSRFEHSRAVAELMVALCAVHRVPFEEMRDAAVAALLHDLGHPPFSHTLERVLARHGHRDHEAIGQHFVESDPELTRLFRAHGIDARRVLEIMREKGSLGLRQKIVDTCAYLRHDGRLAGAPTPPGFVSELFSSIRAIGDACEVEDSRPLEQFMERRARFTADVYEHPYNRVNSLLLSACADWLVRTGRLSVDRLSNGQDSTVLWSLLDAVEEGAPPWVGSARDFLLGVSPRLGGWRIVEAEEDVGQTGDSSACFDRHPSFVLPPIDFTTKTIPVRLPDGRRADVRASPGAREEHHAKWHVITYAGSE